MPYGPTCFMTGGHKVRPYAQIGNIKTFTPLVRRGRPCVGPVYPGNTWSFVTFGRIVAISGGHVSCRADIKSAPTCKLETLTPNAIRADTRSAPTCHLHFIRADIKSAPTHVRVTLAPSRVPGTLLRLHQPQRGGKGLNAKEKSSHNEHRDCRTEAHLH